MKEYFKKILNIVFVKDEVIEYIEKDIKKYMYINNSTNIFIYSYIC